MPLAKVEWLQMFVQNPVEASTALPLHGGVDGGRNAAHRENARGQLYN
jgi:hypothetical protein